MSSLVIFYDARKYVMVACSEGLYIADNQFVLMLRKM